MRQSEKDEKKGCVIRNTSQNEQIVPCIKTRGQSITVKEKIIIVYLRKINEAKVFKLELFSTVSTTPNPLKLRHCVKHK